MKTAAYDTLRNHQEQADMDGVMVKVSRQALDEILDEYDEMLSLLDEARSGWIGWTSQDVEWDERKQALMRKD